MKAGYATDLWTLQRVAKLIETQFRVRYTTVGVWKLLRLSLEWSWQKPERRAIQRDEAAIEQWKTRTWPHIKKRPPTWGPSRVPRRKRVSAHP
jgi:transposase